ncbi:uridine kinase [Flavobacteriaceae bacterium AU392]|nr:uridine kinase [Flavobacteriaceae bacterium]RKM83653.1 uridine kinase [Flavobacteriaceae bacterium AU392]
MLVIGITGGTGCGKTTIVNQILKEFPKKEVGVVSQDAYYKDNSHLSYNERVKINFDHPDSIDFDLLVEHLKVLKAGKAIHQPVYSFVEHNRTNNTIKILPKKVMIIEGILVLTNPDLRNMIDIKVYVNTDSDERLIRRLKRDTSEIGRDLDEVLSRYQTTLKPMHEQFIEPTRDYADIIIPNNKYNTGAVNILRTIINDRL